MNQIVDHGGKFEFCLIDLLLYYRVLIKTVLTFEYFQMLSYRFIISF